MEQGEEEGRVKAVPLLDTLQKVAPSLFAFDGGRKAAVVMHGDDSEWRCEMLAGGAVAGALASPAVRPPPAVPQSAGVRVEVAVVVGESRPVRLMPAAAAASLPLRARRSVAATEDVVDTPRRVQRYASELQVAPAVEEEALPAYLQGTF